MFLLLSFGKNMFLFLIFKSYKYLGKFIFGESTGDFHDIAICFDSNIEI